jgi:hypothetical protein
LTSSRISSDSDFGDDEDDDDEYDESTSSDILTASFMQKFVQFVKSTIKPKLTEHV